MRRKKVEDCVLFRVPPCYMDRQRVMEHAMDIASTSEQILTSNLEGASDVLLYLRCFVL